MHEKEGRRDCVSRIALHCGGVCQHYTVEMMGISFIVVGCIIYACMLGVVLRLREWKYASINHIIPRILICKRLNRCEEGGIGKLIGFPGCITPEEYRHVMVFHTFHS